MIETGAAPSLVPYDFVNVGIEVEAFHKEEVEILEAVGEGRVTEADPNYLSQPAVYLSDLKLNQRKKIPSRDWIWLKHSIVRNSGVTEWKT